MTEETHNDDNQEATPTAEAMESQAAEPAPEGEPEPQTFSADYVKQLREEAAAHRIRAKRTDEANERMVRTIAEMDGRLVNPDEVQLSADMLDDDGVADPGKVREAIGALIEGKPYLAKRTPTTPLPMGVQQSIEPPPSLFEMVRERI